MQLASLFPARRCAALLLTGLLGCQRAAEAPACTEALELPGTYQCAGTCTGADGKPFAVSGETDVVTALGGGLYELRITAGSFSEVELGGLAGRVLHTATAQVSDGNYPVLEDDHFAVDAACKATGFQKIVRNPTLGAFKACAIGCTKQ